jgi:hypothetical protein
MPTVQNLKMGTIIHLWEYQNNLARAAHDHAMITSYSIEKYKKNREKTKWTQVLSD